MYYPKQRKSYKKYKAAVNSKNYTNTYTRWSFPSNIKPSKKASFALVRNRALRKFLVPKIKARSAAKRTALNKVLAPKFGVLARNISQYAY